MPKSDTQVDRPEKCTQQGEHQLALLARNNIQKTKHPLKKKKITDKTHKNLSICIILQHRWHATFSVFILNGNTYLCVISIWEECAVEGGKPEHQRVIEQQQKILVSWCIQRCLVFRAVENNYREKVNFLYSIWNWEFRNHCLQNCYSLQTWHENLLIFQLTI